MTEEICILSTKQVKKWQQCVFQVRVKLVVKSINSEHSCRKRVLTRRRYGDKSETNVNPPDGALKISTARWFGGPTCWRTALLSLNCKEKQIISACSCVAARLAAAGITAREAAIQGTKMKEHELSVVSFILSTETDVMLGLSWSQS